VDAFRARLAAVRNKLYDARAKRVWPGRDEKFLTAWNGLMIAAFAKFGAVLDGKYIGVAALAADFILTNMRTADGRLFRTAGAGSRPSSAAIWRTTRASPTR
jgi:uncharacterized protein YyaL (SSP411 family)